MQQNNAENNVIDTWTKEEYRKPQKTYCNL